MDRIREMETFLRVVEAGSFSAAARDLDIGQPAVSKIVAGLERRLGIRLLARSTRRLTPTEAGLAFYERARRAMAEADEAETAARGAAMRLEGRLRVSAPVTFGRLHVVPKLGAFLDAHPRLRLELVMDDRAIDLLAENIDAALRLGALPDSGSGLTARRLARADRLVVATPSYLARCGFPSAPEDLRDHQSIVYRQTAGGPEWVFRRGKSEVPVRLEPRLKLSAAEGVREAVLAGLGLTIASRWLFAPEMVTGEVVAVLQEWSLPPVDLWVTYPSGRLKSAKAKAFVEWFESTLDLHSSRSDRTGSTRAAPIAAVGQGGGGSQSDHSLREGSLDRRASDGQQRAGRPVAGDREQGPRSRGGR